MPPLIFANQIFVRTVCKCFDLKWTITIIATLIAAQRFFSTSNSFRNVVSNIQLHHQLFNLRITHSPQFKTDSSLSKLTQASGTVEVTSKEERLTIRRKRTTIFTFLKVQTLYSNILQIPSIALCLCRSTDIKGTCTSWGIRVV